MSVDSNSVRGMYFVGIAIIACEYGASWDREVGPQLSEAEGWTCKDGDTTACTNIRAFFALLEKHEWAKEAPPLRASSEQQRSAILPDSVPMWTPGLDPDRVWLQM